ncbi:hypothetical protein AsAng_0023910 [Aureispira anguillae]|uniref:Uncharacterized protein n=1 Tax=Aureispira anguillae TaxID=2864201 RepID=A0A915YEQ4_9BACT|nr:hypothetical protein AsAng_0023910 [Aureispira anguillae]
MHTSAYELVLLLAAVNSHLTLKIFPIHFIRIKGITFSLKKEDF